VGRQRLHETRIGKECLIAIFRKCRVSMCCVPVHLSTCLAAYCSYTVPCTYSMCPLQYILHLSLGIQHVRCQQLCHVYRRCASGVHIQVAQSESETNGTSRNPFGQTCHTTHTSPCCQTCHTTHTSPCCQTCHTTHTTPQCPT
jgi:hypothetical protein